MRYGSRSIEVYIFASTIIERYIYNFMTTVISFVKEPFVVIPFYTFLTLLWREHDVVETLGPIDQQTNLRINPFFVPLQVYKAHYIWARIILFESPQNSYNFVWEIKHFEHLQFYMLSKLIIMLSLPIAFHQRQTKRFC